GRPVASLDGRSCVVTGAARGIGRGIAERLLADGASVCLADLNEEGLRATEAELAGEHGGGGGAPPCDATPRAAAREAVGSAADAFGRVDVMFNNAGLSQAKRFLEIDEEEWQRLMDVNGLGVLLGIQEAAKRMIEQGGGGAIVNTASIAGR